MYLINLKNIEKTFGTGEGKVVALKNINLNINEGELIAIMGASGSGKTTLMNIIGTLDTVTNGDYIFKDDNIAKIKGSKIAKIRNKSFGFVVQHFALISDYTVFENIQIPLEYGNVKYRERKKIVIDLLEKFGLKDKINKTPKQLSGGQCQRVAIARAIANSPEVILADEPTGALDQKTGQEIIDLFIKLNNEGKTVIIVTHDINVAARCNRIIKIEDGKIVEDNSSEVVIA